MFLTNEQITKILKKPALYFTEQDYRYGKRELDSVGSVLSLVVYDYECNDNYPRMSEIRSGIKYALKKILYGGGEPTFNNSHNWGYPALAQIFALIKNKKALWEMFNQDEQERITCLMKMFALMWNFGCNKYNHFRTGIGLHGNYSKDRNPNYLFSNDAIILYCVHFFGDLRAVNKIMANTKYDEIISELNHFGFTNALRTWTTPGFEKHNGELVNGARELYGVLEDRQATPYYSNEAHIIDSEGNIYNAGKGKGCTLPFFYEDRDNKVKDFISYPKNVYIKLLNKCFNGGVCQDSINIVSEDFQTGIKDHSVSPYNGMEGMMLEFNSTDSMGIRSSLFHSEIDFYLVAMMVKSLKLLGIDVFADAPELEAKTKVGMLDCIYKKKHGYIGYSMGEIENEYRSFDREEWINDWESIYPLSK